MITTTLLARKGGMASALKLPPKKKEKTKLTSVAVEIGLLERVQAKALKDGYTMKDVIVGSFKSYLDE